MEIEGHNTGVKNKGRVVNTWLLNDNDGNFHCNFVVVMDVHCSNLDHPMRPQTALECKNEHSNSKNQIHDLRKPPPPSNAWGNNDTV